MSGSSSAAPQTSGPTNRLFEAVEIAVGALVIMPFTIVFATDRGSYSGTAMIAWVATVNGILSVLSGDYFTAAAALSIGYGASLLIAISFNNTEADRI